MEWTTLKLHQKTYRILNPNNWEELSYGIHKNVLVPNDNTEVKEEIKEKISPCIFELLITD